jgi:formylglycine-generating enzyme required for sulfatase activity
MKSLSTVSRNILLLLILFNVLFQQPLTAQNATLGQIHFSKDSLAITGFELNARSIFLPQPVSIVQWERMLSQQKQLEAKLLSVQKMNDGFQLRLQFKNTSKDTLIIDNVLPFEKSQDNIYITGKGNHSLSRTHLFIPGKMPVNVIVPDNAWELGFNTLSIDQSFSIYGFSRRDKQSIALGKTKRFETILYPKGSIQYNIWLAPYKGSWQNGLLKVFRDKKLYDLSYFNDSLYKRKDLAWVRNTYLMHLMMSWDKFFYNATQNKYTLPSFVDRGNKLYGGDDIITIWPSWPTLGLDQRNQFDLYKDLPGGLSAIKKISNDLIAENKHLFVSYNPWDVDTHKQNHYSGLSWLINNTNADGVVLDTQGSSSDTLQNSADTVRKGVIMYSEGMAVPKDMQGIIAGRVHNALYYPPMLNLNKFIQPGFSIYRVAELYKEPIQREFATSFFNGYGTEINIMAAGQPEWVEKQYAFLGKTTQLLRQLSDNFNSNNATPLIPTTADSIWVNQWTTPQKIVYTIYSTIPQGYKNDLFEVSQKYNWHFVDVYHHKLLKPTFKKGKYFIEAETDAFHQKYLGTNNEGTVDCIIHVPKLLETTVVNNTLQIQVTKNTIIKRDYSYLDNTELAIHIWTSEVGWGKPNLVLPYKNQTIDINKIAERFEGKIIIQVVQLTKDTFGNKNNRITLLDEQIEYLNAGIPRLKENIEPISNHSFNNTNLLDTTNMVKIEKGTFLFKQTHGDDFIAYPSIVDTNLIDMPSYWMDKYLVTNADFYKFIQESKYQPTDTVNYLKHWVAGAPLVTDYKKPVVYISYEDAQAYAHWNHKILPSEIQWQYAGQTSSLQEWPWKQEKPVTREVEEITGTLSTVIIKGIDSSFCNLGNGVLDTVGAYPKGVNANGLYDLVGAVWQLTSSKYVSGSYEYIIMKGGSYFKPSGSWWYVQAGPRELTYAQYLLRVSQGFERNGTVGFRCVANSPIKK